MWERTWFPIQHHQIQANMCFDHHRITNSHQVNLNNTQRALIMPTPMDSPPSHEQNGRLHDEILPCNTAQGPLCKDKSQQVGNCTTPSMSLPNEKKKTRQHCANHQYVHDHAGPGQNSGTRKNNFHQHATMTDTTKNTSLTVAKRTRQLKICSTNIGAATTVSAWATAPKRLNP